MDRNSCICSICPSKALAKIANKIAKKFTVRAAGFTAFTEEKRIKALKWTSIGEVWGIGRQHRLRLEAIGVQTALTLLNCPTTGFERI